MLPSATVSYYCAIGCAGRLHCYSGLGVRSPHDGWACAVAHAILWVGFVLARVCVAVVVVITHKTHAHVSAPQHVVAQQQPTPPATCRWSCMSHCACTRLKGVEDETTSQRLWDKKGGTEKSLQGLTMGVYFVCRRPTTYYLGVCFYIVLLLEGWGQRRLLTHPGVGRCSRQDGNSQEWC